MAASFVAGKVRACGLAVLSRIPPVACPQCPPAGATTTVGACGGPGFGYRAASPSLQGMEDVRQRWKHVGSEAMMGRNCRGQPPSPRAAQQGPLICDGRDQGSSLAQARSSGTKPVVSCPSSAGSSFTQGRFDGEKAGATHHSAEAGALGSPGGSRHPNPARGRSLQRALFIFSITRRFLRPAAFKPACRESNRVSPPAGPSLRHSRIQSTITPTIGESEQLSRNAGRQSCHPQPSRWGGTPRPELSRRGLGLALLKLILEAHWAQKWSSYRLGKAHAVSTLRMLPSQPGPLTGADTWPE